MTRCYLGVSPALNYSTWTSKLPELSSELHLCSLMLLLLLSSSCAECCVKGWMIKAGFFLAELRRLLFYCVFIKVSKYPSCHFSKLILSSPQSKVTLPWISSLQTQLPIPWGHDCTAASWPWTYTQLMVPPLQTHPWLQNFLLFLWTEAEFQSFILAWTWPHKVKE